MYAPSYGFGPGNNNSAAPFNPNGPPLQNPQHLHQQQQNLMYNPGPPPPQQQQYGPAGGHAAQGGGPYMGANNGGPGNGGMMQNAGLAHAGAGHAVSPYQTPYTSSPYGASIPTSASTSLPPNYIPTSSNAPAFQMSANHPSMHPQQQQQRMQPPPSVSTPQSNSGPRASPYGGAPQGTPPNSAPLQQSQFSTPQTSNTSHLQTPNNAQQQGGGGIITPQTPNFPPATQNAGNAGAQIATPLSPGSESREKERVSLLLEINSELLKEAMGLQAVQKEIAGNTTNSPESASGDKEGAEKEKVEQKAVTGKEYVECMRRLQCNLAYLAAIADRSHKPSSQIPPHPAIMSAPPLNSKPTSSTTSSPNPKPETKAESGGKQEEKADSILKEQYEKLQALFPGVDPKKDPPIQTAAKKPQQQGQVQGQSQSQGQGQGAVDNQQMLKMQMQQRMEQQAKQQHQQHQQQQVAQVGAANR